MSEIGRPMAIPAGTVLGREYRIEGLLARGGMGVIYRATQLGVLNRAVALKVIAPELAGDPAFRERFLNESQIAASLDHPNVVPIYEALEDDGLLFVTMRLIDGTDLRVQIERGGALEPRRAVRLIAQVASALDTAHARGLVHRDIKSANVLITGSGEDEHAYLTDFGLAKHAADTKGMTQSGMFVGTVDYAAPEQIEGEAVDARTDVYALGCVLFEALTGRVPYESTTLTKAMLAHVRDPVPRLSEVAPHLPPLLGEVIERAMAKSPADRFHSAGDLAKAARGALEGRPFREAGVTVATGDAAPGATIVSKDAPRTVEAPTPAPPATVQAATPAPPATVQAATPTAPATAQAAPPPPAPARNRRNLLYAGAGAATVAIVALVLVLALGGGGEEENDDPPAETTAAQTTPPSTQAEQDTPALPADEPQPGLYTGTVTGGGEVQIMVGADSTTANWTIAGYEASCAGAGSQDGRTVGGQGGGITAKTITMEQDGTFRTTDDQTQAAVPGRYTLRGNLDAEQGAGTFSIEFVADDGTFCSAENLEWTAQRTEGGEPAPAPAAEPEPAPEPAPAPAPAAESCGDVTFTEASGDGAFDVSVRGIGCAEAENLLRSESGLTSWDCDVVKTYGDTSKRYRCTEGGQTIRFTLGS
jgi:predicted Ser/Thr protein kinase